MNTKNKQELLAKWNHLKDIQAGIEKKLRKIQEQLEELEKNK